jgi:hypothetical protein
VQRSALRNSRAALSVAGLAFFGLIRDLKVPAQTGPFFEQGANRDRTVIKTKLKQPRIPAVELATTRPPET